MTRRIVNGQTEDACPRCGLLIPRKPPEEQAAAFARLAETVAQHPDAQDVGYSTLFVCDGCGHSWVEHEAGAPPPLSAPRPLAPGRRLPSSGQIGDGRKRGEG